jgi:HSP20 family protein
MAETEEEVKVRAEVPGMDPAEVEVTIVGNELVLAGEKKESQENQGKDFFQSESRYGAFRRSFVLPATVDTENVAAQCANGVLTLRLKKTRPTPPKRIEVKPGS